MNEPIVHPSTKLLLDSLIADLPQSVLLIGPIGVGLGTIAKYIAAQNQTQPSIVLPEKDDKIDLEKGVISVDMIRRLYMQTRTIETKKRIIIIDYAERMGIGAQNAFLKLLEEPGQGTYFILATHSSSKLLPTITSRVRLLEIRSITVDQSNTLLDHLDVQDKTKRLQLLFMATGLPAELNRLVGDNGYFEQQSNIMRDARTLLQSKIYEKLLVAHKYKDSRPDALILLSYAENILRRSISAKPQLGLILQIDGLLGAYQHIQANGNIRLCLARLVL